MKVQIKQGFGLFLLLLFLLPCSVSTVALADVAGCQSVAVDPEASYEMQQAVCSAAELDEATSCSAEGYGVCSSPKKDGTLMEGTNCICIQEEEAVAEPILE